MLHWLTHLLETSGPFVVFGLVFLESMGLPFPGETILLTGAALAATGRLSIAWVFLASALGGFLGGAAGYALGRAGMGAWVRRRGGRGSGAGGHLTESLDRAHALFERHGGKSVLAGRFVAVVRSFVFIAAGAACMAPIPFLAWDAAGAVLWSGAFAALGYEFGQNLPRLEHTVGAAALAGAGALALAVALGLLIRWTWRHQDRIWESASAFWEAHLRPRLGRLADRYPRVWGFARARLSPAGYLGLHLTAGILVSLLALWLFGGVLEDVVAGEPLTQFDRVLSAQLHLRATPAGIDFFRVMSFIGSPPSWTVIAVAVLVWLMQTRQHLLAGSWAAAILGSGLLDFALKLLVHRPRPVFATPFDIAPGWSFPSGHSMGALVGFGMIAYFLLLRTRSPAARVAIVSTAALLTLLVGFSRLYLGVHFFSDVVGGFAVGIVWLSACVTGLEVARRRRAFRAAVAEGARKAG